MATDPVVLREQFAAAALSSMGWNAEMTQAHLRVIARACWNVADTMIQEQGYVRPSVLSRAYGMTPDDNPRDNIPKQSSEEDTIAF